MSLGALRTAGAGVGQTMVSSIDEARNEGGLNVLLDAIPTGGTNDGRWAAAAGAPALKQEATKCLPNSPVFDMHPDGSIEPDKAQGQQQQQAGGCGGGAAGGRGGGRARAEGAVGQGPPPPRPSGASPWPAPTAGEAQGKGREAACSIASVREVQLQVQQALAGTVTARAPPSRRGSTDTTANVREVGAGTSAVMQGTSRSFAYNPPTLHVVASEQSGGAPLVMDMPQQGHGAEHLPQGNRTFVLSAGSDETSKWQRLWRLNIMRERRPRKHAARKVTDSEIRRKMRNRWSAKLARERHRIEFTRLKTEVKLLELSNSNLLEKNAALTRMLSTRGVTPGSPLLRDRAN